MICFRADSISGSALISVLAGVVAMNTKTESGATAAFRLPLSQLPAAPDAQRDIKATFRTR